MKSSLNQITKAFNACITGNTPANCNGANINGTLNSQPGVKITVDNVANKNCFLVDAKAGGGFTGCVQINDIGKIDAISNTPSLIKGTASACKAGNGECTP